MATLRIKGDETVRFFDKLQRWPKERVQGLIDVATAADVDRAVAAQTCGPRDLAALLSPHARLRLEEMASKAQRLTRWHFGRTIAMYAPIYLSNVCTSDCTYCGFAVRSGFKEKRVTLESEAIRRECETLAARGFESVLLLTGDAPGIATLDYIEHAVRIAREHFASVSIEVFAMDGAEYKRLCDAGLEGVTLYMETYDRETYAQVHLTGKKRDFRYRLDALERAGAAGAWKLNLGALLGLFDWRIDGFWLGLHARHMQRVCWQSAIALSFPRLRNVPDRFQVVYQVSDPDLVQLMLALRLFLPEVGFVMSTRETAAFRDHLIPLGITQMSAGSSTRPGGYATYGDETLEQFAIEDHRPPRQVVAAIRQTGYDPVWKDFDHAFLQT